MSAFDFVKAKYEAKEEVTEKEFLHTDLAYCSSKEQSKAVADGMKPFCVFIVRTMSIMGFGMKRVLLNVKKIILINKFLKN